MRDHQRNSAPSGRRLIVNGGRPLEGTVSASGSKYSAMLALTAAFLSPAGAVLRNIPRIRDVEAIASIGSYLGVRINRAAPGVVVIDASSMENRTIPIDLAGKLHSSYLLLPVLAARFDRASVGFPGGCRVDDERYPGEISGVFRQFGFDMEIDRDRHQLKVLRSGEPDPVREFDFSDLSARDITVFSKTAMLLAAATPGTTAIRRPFKGPEIRDMAAVLRQLGARVAGVGGDLLFVEGAGEHRPMDHTILPDWIEGLTLLAAGFMTDGRVTVDNLPAVWMGSELAALTWMGADLNAQDDPPGENIGISTVCCSRASHLQSARLSTGTYPGLNTDGHPILAACLTQCPGQSEITELVFSQRSHYVEPFRRMNAEVVREGDTVRITGPAELRGAAVNGHDIRTCAALVLLALAAKGETVIEGCGHLHRGYDDLAAKIRSLGGDVVETTS